jgi:hypothetical protein
VHSTPTDVKRFSQVPLDSSAASSPLPLATMAAAVLDSRFRSMNVPVAVGELKTGDHDFTLPAFGIAKRPHYR